MPDIEVKNLREFLTIFGDELVSRLKTSFEKPRPPYNADRGHRAGGGLERSMRFSVKFLGDHYRFQLMLADYYKFLDDGRGITKSGSKPGKLRDRIRKWIKEKQGQGFVLKGYEEKKKFFKKGTRKSLFERELDSASFLIARKIHRKGFKGSGWYSEVVNDNLKKELQKSLAQAFKKDVLVEFKTLK